MGGTRFTAGWAGWGGLATNLHEMGVPTKVVQRVCRREINDEEALHPCHRTGRAERRARAGSVDNTRDARTAHCKLLIVKDADVAQLVEQPIRNRQVSGSSPLVGSIITPLIAFVYESRHCTRMAVWLFSVRSLSVKV
jgi:hypothetical protein